MPEQFGDKSYDATPHRRQQAREQGQVARSQDLASAVLLLAAVVGLFWIGPKAVDFLGRYAQMQLGGRAELTADPAAVVEMWRATSIGLAKVFLPLLGLLLITAVLVNLGQVGFLFLPQKLALDASRISPFKGLQRIFAMANAVRLGFGVFKILVVVVVAAWSLWGQRDMILGLSGLTPPQIGVFISDLTLWTCSKIAMALLLLAALDYAFQRWKHEQDLRMTHQEIREEMKSLHGDPQIIARRRAVQRQLVLNRLGSTVPKADVVVTNPTHLAIAIAYDPEKMAAPVVVAKGEGLLAQRIRRLAMENQIPVLERKELARTLYKEVDINQAVPVEQYAAVAEVLRYVYQLKGKTLPDAGRAA